MCYIEARLISQTRQGSRRGLRGNVHGKGHERTYAGEPRFIPERPVLRVSGIVGTVPSDQVRVSVRLGKEGQHQHDWLLQWGILWFDIDDDLNSCIARFFFGLGC